MSDERITAPVESIRVGNAACPYCGQNIILPMYIFATTEQEAILYAGEHCNCPEARRQRVLQTADEKVDALFDGHGEDARDLLKTAVRAVADGAVEQISVRLDCYTDAKISENSKGLLLITKKRKSEHQEAIG